MESKYYTPTIEEFHAGFEFEEYTTKWSYPVKHIKGDQYKVLENPKKESGWYATTYDLDYFLHIDDVDRVIEWNKIDPDKIRVKYLDKEDIESLGFVCTKSHPCEKIFERDDYNSSKIIIELLEWMVSSNFSEPVEYRKLLIYRTEGVPIKDPDGRYKGVSGSLFDGTIKNKSELKVLLKQLGIDE